MLALYTLTSLVLSAPLALAAPALVPVPFDSNLPPSLDLSPPSGESPQQVLGMSHPSHPGALLPTTTTLVFGPPSSSSTPTPALDFASFTYTSYNPQHTSPTSAKRAAIAPRGDGAAAARNITFDTCPGSPKAAIKNIQVSPCEADTDGVCTYRPKTNYTITITYKSLINSTRPRSGLRGRDETMSIGSGVEYFAYPGQAFDACRYTACPILAHTTSTYTYNLTTFASVPFDQLTFNVTDWIDGPILFCASIPAHFES